MLTVDRAACTLYELYRAFYVPAAAARTGTPTPASPGTCDSAALRPDGWTSADAAGLPIFPGLVRYDEVAAGQLEHAIRVTFESTRDAWVHPAAHCAGDTASAGAPPMGLRLRLKAGYGLGRFSGPRATIALAMKRYGLIVADNGSNWFFSGSSDRRWDDENLNQLKRIPGSAFEVVKSAARRPPLLKQNSNNPAGPADRSPSSRGRGRGISLAPLRCTRSRRGTRWPAALALAALALSPAPQRRAESTQLRDQGPLGMLGQHRARRDRLGRRRRRRRPDRRSLAMLDAPANGSPGAEAQRPDPGPQPETEVPDYSNIKDPSELPPASAGSNGTNSTRQLPTASSSPAPAPPPTRESTSILLTGIALPRPMPPRRSRA